MSLSKSVSEPPSLYIFTEGTKTEPLYLNGLKKHLCVDIIKDIIPTGQGTTDLLQRAVAYGDERQLGNAEIWCVYDKDDFAETSYNAMAEEAAALNRQDPYRRYQLAMSNECVEVWFLLHFQYLASSTGRKDYTCALNRIFARYDLGYYKKNRSDIFEILLTHGNGRMAMKNARRLLDPSIPPAKNVPSTTLYQLIERLLPYLDEETREFYGG